MSNDRRLSASAQVFSHSRDVPAEPVSRMEGADEAGGLAIKPVLVGGEMLLMVGASLSSFTVTLMV